MDAGAEGGGIITSRRQFLINGLLAAGAWLLAPRLARQIEHFAGEHGTPYLVDVDRPELVIYANDSIEGYHLTLGVPLEDDIPALLTWEDWAEIKGIDSADTKAILECAADYGLYGPDSIGVFSLEKEVPATLMNEYVDWEFVIRDSASAQAHHYLADLDLGPLQPRAGAESLGELLFMEGPCPGNNSSLVYAETLETLSCLQQRLLSLNISTDIRVV